MCSYTVLICNYDSGYFLLMLWQKDHELINIDFAWNTLILITRFSFVTSRRRLNAVLQ